MDEPVRRRARMPARRALPPIRTLTVGPGISPGQPVAGSDRVADCNRRFGLSPTPECAALVYRASVPRRVRVHTGEGCGVAHRSSLRLAPGPVRGRAGSARIGPYLLTYWSSP